MTQRNVIDKRDGLCTNTNYIIYIHSYTIDADSTELVHHLGNNYFSSNTICMKCDCFMAQLDKSCIVSKTRGHFTNCKHLVGHRYYIPNRLVAPMHATSIDADITVSYSLSQSQ